MSSKTITTTQLPSLSKEDIDEPINDDTIIEELIVDDIKIPELLSDELEWSGRDSGISSETPRYEEIDSKYAGIELDIEEKVLSSQRELQDAKKKLEELRLLRFEEKNVFRKEIEQLHDRVDEEERNTNQLEQLLTNTKAENVAQSQQMKHLHNEQEIASRINTMQEQQIARLEMRLKEEELEKINISKQLDQQRRSSMEKDKLRMKQQGDIYILNERVAQLEDSNIYYKNESESNFNKLRENDHKIQSMKQDLVSVSHDLQLSKSEALNTSHEAKQLQAEKATLQNDFIESQREVEELRDEVINLKRRCTKSEADYTSRENIFQKDLENASFNESKLTREYEELEKQFHDIRCEKDEQYFALKQITVRHNDNEQKNQELQVQKDKLEVDLKELSDTLWKHFTTNETYVPSPSKGEEIITCNEVNEYFASATTKMFSMNREIEDLSSQIHIEQSIASELNDTLSELKEELGKAQDNITNISALKQTLQSQHQRTNETLLIQERDIEQKNAEINDLRKTLNDYKRKIERLENELSSVNDELSSVNDDAKSSSQRFKEERKKMKFKIEQIETRLQMNDSAKQKTETKLEEDRERFKKRIQAKEKENKDLKVELERLIDDNKSLTQRLIHLESYSDRLSDMLEKQQNEGQRLKEKVSKELKQYKHTSGEKEQKISTLKSKVNEMNRSLNEKHDENEYLGNKINNMQNDHRDVEDENKELRRSNDELRERLDLVNEAHMKAERKVISLNEQVDNIDERNKQQQRTVEQWSEKTHTLEQERQILRDNLHNTEKRLQLKESVVAELSRKSGQATENYNALRSTIEKAEVQEQQYQQKFINMKRVQVKLEKDLDANEAEKIHLREQITNLQSVLAKCEDEKEKSLSDAIHYQRQLENERGTKEQIEHRKQENSKQREDIRELKNQVSALRSELSHEQKRRERLEDMYSRREDQVTQLRSTFDHSLNTLSKDTKNIKSILGKSLKKLDYGLENPDGETTMSGSEVMTDTTTDTVQQYTPTTRLSGSRYLNLPSHRSNKSFETTTASVNEVHRHKDKPNITTTPKSYRKSDRNFKSQPTLIPSSRLFVEDHLH